MVDVGAIIHDGVIVDNGQWQWWNHDADGVIIIHDGWWGIGRYWGDVRWWMEWW